MPYGIAVALRKEGLLALGQRQLMPNLSAEWRVSWFSNNIGWWLVVLGLGSGGARWEGVEPVDTYSAGSYGSCQAFQPDTVLLHGEIDNADWMRCITASTSLHGGRRQK